LDTGGTSGTSQGCFFLPLRKRGEKADLELGRVRTKLATKMIRMGERHYWAILGIKRALKKEHKRA